MTPRLRRIALVIVLATQSVMFAALLHRPLAVESDNSRYEEAAWNLARGQHLSLPYRLAADDDVHDWVCSRHPDACHDGIYPVAMYPPGYSFFVAAIYRVCGRSLFAVIIVQWLLLMVTFLLFEAIAARKLGREGYLFAMAVAAVYPFLAYQAARIMSDHLGVVLTLATLATHVLMRPGWRRGLSFGALGAAATLTRPYSLLVFPVLFAWPSIWRAVNARRTERLIAVVAFVLPLAMWTARNAYWFGRFIPMTTNGVGLTLLHTTLEFDQGLYEGSEARYYADVVARYGNDGMSHHSSQVIMHDAIEKVRARPGKMVERILVHVPKLWVSLGSSDGKSRAWPLLLLSLGTLWLLGIAGMIHTRGDASWHLFTLTILLYWLFLLPLPGEARRTLPLRLPHLLLAATVVGDWFARRRAAKVRS
jgi:4-amino-4-deoxy-L-arabinose transferase-like glycosyltransferase